MTQFSAVLTLNRVFALPVFQEIYPWCTGVFLIVECGDGPSQRPPTTIRFRTRGRHQPGDGDYFCSHVTAPLGANGFRNGTGLYLTQLQRTKCMYRKEAFWFDFDGKSFNIEYFDGSQNYYYEQYTYRKAAKVGNTWRVTYSMTKWAAFSRIPTTYESLSSQAFAKDPIDRSNTVLGSGYNGPFLPVASPEFEEHYMAQQIQNETIPNIGVYLNDVYIEAFNSLPMIETNNIANLKMIYDVLKVLAHPKDVVYEGVGSLKDAWMGYRYQYNTTKADILELSQYADRMRTFKHLKSVTGHGTKHYSINGEEYTFKCALHTSADDYLGIYNTVEQFGLALDGYNVWDMIPYSFVVDWFLHIGDLLESARSREYAMRLKPSAVWFSVSHRYTNRSGCEQVDYYRWSGSVSLTQYPASMLTRKSSRGATWVKRAADAFCLFT